jgi:hypothetical protein
MKNHKDKKARAGSQQLYSTRRAPLDDGMMLASCFNACDAHIDERLVVVLL